MGEDSEGEVTQHQRRMRTKFTSEQISKLETAFNKHKYLGAMQRRKIAEKLNLSETQVGLRQRVWRPLVALQRPLRKSQQNEEQLIFIILGSVVV